MRQATRPQRPVYLDLMRIRQPLPAVVSILHRTSGLSLFLLLPVAIRLLSAAFASPAAFAHCAARLESLPVRMLLAGCFWFFWHHLFAGIRHLGLDLHRGLSRAQARRTSRWVLLAGVAMTVLTEWWL